MFDRISKFAGLRLFSSMEKLMSYAINQMGLHGTHIFITDLHRPSDDQLELVARSNDIEVRHERRARDELVDMILTQPWLIENSLSKYANFMFLSHPSFLQLSINGKQTERLENPFNKLMDASGKTRQWFHQVKTNEFALQMLTPAFAAQVRNFEAEAALLEGGLSCQEALELLQGVLVYRGNRLVRRLQGKFSGLREQAQIVADLMRE